MQKNLFLSALLIAATGPALAAEAPATNSLPATVVTALPGYAKWGRINPEPVFVPSASAFLCAPPVSPVKSNDPHENKYINVYVNPLGRPAMLAGKTNFPAGSIIVKEKLPSAKSSKPELLTVMIKREAGFAPATGDWQFAAMTGAGNQVLPGGTTHCATCHEARKESDWVFRKYVPKPR